MNLAATLAAQGSANLIIPALFLMGLLGLGVAVALGAFRQSKHQRAAQDQAVEMQIRAEARANEIQEQVRQNAERGKQHMERVEKLLEEIRDLLARRG